MCIVKNTLWCVDLSIREAPKSAKTTSLEEMRVTAMISHERLGVMNQIGGMTEDRG